MPNCGRYWSCRKEDPGKTGRKPDKGENSYQSQLSQIFAVSRESVWASQVVLVVKNLLANAGDIKRQELSPWVGKIPWRKWQATPVVFPGEFHGQRSLVDYSPWGHKELSQISVVSRREENTFCTPYVDASWVQHVVQYCHKYILFVLAETRQDI